MLCKFQNVMDMTQMIEFELVMRRFFDQGDVEGQPVKRAVISRELAPPGELTQSLCSPWQNDYRECACFYWAATRPDYVNVEPGSDGTSIGHNWMQKNRTTETPKVYLPDDWMDPTLVTYLELFRDWEKSLRFVIEGKMRTLLRPGAERPVTERPSHRGVARGRGWILEPDMLPPTGRRWKGGFRDLA